MKIPLRFIALYIFFIGIYGICQGEVFFHKLHLI